MVVTSDTPLSVCLQTDGFQRHARWFLAGREQGGGQIVRNRDRDKRVLKLPHGCVGKGVYNRLRMIDLDDRIQIEPRVCHGRAIIRGTRVPVTIVLGSLVGGMSDDEVQREYGISVEDIRAAIHYANGLVVRERHYPLMG